MDKRFLIRSSVLFRSVLFRSVPFHSIPFQLYLRSPEQRGADAERAARAEQETARAARLEVDEPAAREEQRRRVITDGFDAAWRCGARREMGL